ncbi:hypothetical protein L2E81_12650 [Planktothrix agardhii 1033]|nr:hypothetical protein [Planktothrix agardhii 1033]
MKIAVFPIPHYLLPIPYYPLPITHYLLPIPLFPDKGFPSTSGSQW